MLTGIYNAVVVFFYIVFTAFHKYVANLKTYIHTGTLSILVVVCFVFFNNNCGFNYQEMGLLQMIKEIAEFHHRPFVF